MKKRTPRHPAPTTFVTWCADGGPAGRGDLPVIARAGCPKQSGTADTSTERPLRTLSAVSPRASVDTPPPPPSRSGLPAGRFPTRGEAARELARRSFLHYARLAMPAMEWTPFHRNYYRVLEAFAAEKIRRLIVTVPPQHGKSTGSSILLPAWLLGRRPDTRIAVASYSLRLASRFNRRVQQLIDMPLYGRTFPETRLRPAGAFGAGLARTAEEFDLWGRDGGLLAVGREGPLTGNTVDVFILDDLYKDAMEANSPLIRDNAWEWYNSVVRSRLHNRSQELVVFTRWHEDDLIGRLASREPVTELHDLAQLDAPPGEGWLRLNFEAVKRTPPTRIDSRRQGGALWPGRQSAELLEEKRKLDPRWFETLYQGRPAAAEELLYGDLFRVYDDLPETIVKRGNYTDTADTGEDYLCSVCYVVADDGRICVTDVVYTGEPMEVTERLVADMLAANDTRSARVESNNGGRGFARAVQRAVPRIRVEWFHQGRNKEARILSNSATVLRCVLMPRGWESRWGDFHADLRGYRRLFRSNRRHDAPDVLTGIVETEAAPFPKKIHALALSR